MSGLCARCHFQQPFAPGEEFCIDCEAEVQEILAVLTEREEIQAQGDSATVDSTQTSRASRSASAEE